MNVALAILWKDLLTEWRSRDRVVAMATFAFLVVVILRFALPQQSPSDALAMAPGLLWVAFLFAALLGLNRSFALELDNEALSGLALAPVDRGWIFAGKAAANFAVLGVVQAATAAVFGLAFGVDLTPYALRLSVIVALGSIGLCAAGTLFSAMAVRTRYREVMLPLLLLPLMLPVLLGAVEATRTLFLEDALPFAKLQLLIVTDAVFLIVSFLGFDYVLDE